MSKWEDFELESTKFLKNQYGEYAEFTHKGGSDSTIADIKVTTKNHSEFYIEAKHSPAQCGQFVLRPNYISKKFEFSKLNAYPLNEYSECIIEHMNKNFDLFANAGTAGTEIIFQNCEKIFAGWIIDSYKKKNVKFFITNDFKILSIDNFPKAFKVSAKYRVKKSGSSSVGSSKLKSIQEYLKNNFGISEFRVEKDKLFVASNQNLNNVRFHFQNCEFMFALRGGVYEIRKLSKTLNANVIFSIRLTDDVVGLAEKDFISFLVDN